MIHSLLLPLIVVVLLVVIVDAVDATLDVADEALMVTAGVSRTGDDRSEMGEDGGDDFMSISSGDLLVGFAVCAPFNAELLANCK